MIYNATSLKKGNIYVTCLSSAFCSLFSKLFELMIKTNQNKIIISSRNKQ